MAKRKNEDRAPRWLQPMWDRKKRETAKRVGTAVEHLTTKATPVTLESVRDAVKSLFGVSISTNTIQRNDEAYEIYLKHAKVRRTQQKGNGPLMELLRATTGSTRVALRAKINRLRRESKDAVIFRFFQLEERLEGQAKREDNLREEVLRLTLKSRRKGAMK